MTKALEVSIDEEVIGIFVPAPGHIFSVFFGNLPRTYMRVQVISGSDFESWYWQLPNIHEGQVISFRMIETNKRGAKPARVEILTQEEREARLEWKNERAKQLSS